MGSCCYSLGHSSTHSFFVFCLFKFTPQNTSGLYPSFICFFVSLLKLLFYYPESSLKGCSAPSNDLAMLIMIRSHIRQLIDRLNLMILFQWVWWDHESYQGAYATERLKDSGRQNDEKMWHETAHSQSCATFSVFVRRKWLNQKLTKKRSLISFGIVL